MKKAGAGVLNSRVTIKHLAAGQDALGQPIPTWSDLATVWADVRHLSGVETIKANRETSIVQSSIRIRRRTDVTAAMRVVLGATTYQITAVLPDAQGREFVDLVCEIING